MTAETIFDLASVTKIFGTASLAALMVERGWLSWETPVRAVLPEYPYPEIQLKHLLAHTAGLPAWVPFWEKLRERFHPKLLHKVSVEERQEAMRELCFAVSPEARPGERALYSDLTFLTAGFLLERVTGRPLDKAVSELLWEPMGIKTAFYRRVTESAEEAKRHPKMDEVAATEKCPWRAGVLQGQVHDDNCWAMGGYGGHAGAFGKIRDVLQFSKRLFEGFFSEQILRAMWTRVPEPAGCERTLGWDTPSGPTPAASRLFSSSTVGHLGFTGTSLWIDPEAGLAVCLLSNRVHPSRENARIKPFRPRLHEALRLDLNVRHR